MTHCLSPLSIYFRPYKTHQNQHNIPNRLSLSIRKKHLYIIISTNIASSNSWLSERRPLLMQSSKVRALPLGVAAERSPHYLGLSGVHALPLGVAAKRSVHYICYYFSFFLFLYVPHTFLPEGFIVGFRNFAWGFKSQKK